MGERDVETMVRPVVEAAGLELVEVAFRREQGRKVLRVTIDREGGLDLDRISEVSERISRRLDLQGFEPGRYVLEVSSPGVERPLRTPEDFSRRLGQRVKVRTAHPVEGARNHVGVILAAGPDRIRIATDVGERELSWHDITSARTVFEWGPGATGGRRSAGAPGLRGERAEEGGSR